MRQLYQKGDRVECWFPGKEWIIGTIILVWRLSDTAGQRSYKYECTLDAFGPDVSATFEQDRVRKPEAPRLQRVIRANKIQKRKPK
jgi:hypothetical protein